MYHVYQETRILYTRKEDMYAPACKNDLGGQRYMIQNGVYAGQSVFSMIQNTR
jgi:hypothetical protein